MINKILLGAAAGVAATIPMTILMLAWHKRLPAPEKYPLPPREIFDELMERTGIDDDVSEKNKKNLALAGHFAYGAVTGAIYAPLVSVFQPPNVATGVVLQFGDLDGELFRLAPGSANSAPCDRTSIRAERPDDYRACRLGSDARFSNRTNH